MKEKSYLAKKKKKKKERKKFSTHFDQILYIGWHSDPNGFGSSGMVMTGVDGVNDL